MCLLLWLWRYGLRCWLFEISCWRIGASVLHLQVQWRSCPLLIYRLLLLRLHWWWWWRRRRRCIYRWRLP